MKESIFIGPKIHEDMLEDSKKAAWVGFKAVCANFVGNVRAKNYQEIINIMLRAYKHMGFYISVKIHFVHYYLDLFLLPTCGPRAMNTGNIFARTYLTWKKDTEGNDHPACLLTIVGS